MKSHRRLNLRPRFLVVFAAATLMLAACSSSGGGSSSSSSQAGASGSKPVIALSNSFLGNTWRQTMVNIFQQTASQAKAAGMIAGFKVENTSDNAATTQISQIKSLILEHVNALLIDSASPTALNPVIEQACHAGITVVVFDSLASAPCEYNLEDSIAAYGFGEGSLVAKCMHGTGNVIIARGVVGSAPEKVIYGGQLAALKKYPHIHVVRTVVGQASNPITQQAIAGVLSGLPPVQGVITGGSSYGAVQAFLNAGRKLPCAVYDNSGQALQFWASQHAKNGYTASSLRTEPGQVAAAFWEVLQLLQHKHFPKLLVFPNLTIDQASLGAWTKVVPSQAVAGWVWSEAEFNKEVTAIQNHVSPLPTPAIPSAKI
jgi:ribose transport system substrate-binding protein